MRYVGPIDGHDIAELEQAFRNATELSAEGPIVVHVLTQKGRGYPPAEDDDEKHLHDAPVFDPLAGPPKAVPTGYTQAFAEALIKEAELDTAIVAITAAMAGPDRAAPVPGSTSPTASSTSASPSSTPSPPPPAWRWAGCARSSRSTRRSSTGRGTRSCTTSRCTACRWCSASTAPASPATTAPSHHGVYDMALLSKVPGMRVLAPSSAEELHQMLHDAMRLADDGPVAIRYPKGTARQVGEHEVGSGCAPAGVARRRRLGVHPRRSASSSAAPIKAAERAGRRPGSTPTVWDVRCCAPLDPTMIADAARHAPGGHRRGRRPRRRHRHDDRRPDRCRSRRACPSLVLGLPTRFVPQGEARPHPRPARPRRRRDRGQRALDAVIHPGSC